MGLMNGDGGLALSLPTETQILMTLDLAAPKHQVYRAWTTPELVRQWWGVGQGEVTNVEIDLRVGGAWRYEIFANGSLWGFHGEFLELVQDERVVITEIFDNKPTVATLKTVTFAGDAEHTILTILAQHISQENRDAQVDPHWQEGLKGLKDHLERVALSV